MKTIISLFLFCLLVCVFNLQAADVPLPLINSVNIITGKPTKELSCYEYEYYREGQNTLDGKTINLAKNDWRIGRVKIQRKKESQNQSAIARFIYFPGYTEVFDALNHKSIYRYSQSELLEAVEHYHSSNQNSLYRKERLFWNTSTKTPSLTSRILEDGNEQIHLGCFFFYDSHGNLIQETLAGNLSGQCLIPLLIQSDGRLEKNGVESYSTFYEYAANDPSLLMRQTEDNGSTTSYTYDSTTKQCTSKLKGENKKILSRCFYFYDAMGLLKRTIIDDGKNPDYKDLTGITTRQILTVQSSSENATFGKPLLTENRYLDLETNKEVLLEKVVYNYSSKGELTQKDFYDANGALRYYVHMNYDEQGQIISTVDSRGEAAVTPEQDGECQYNASNQKEAFIDKYGNKTTYLYDDFGRLIKTIFPKVLDGQDRVVQPHLIQEYDVRNNVIAVTDANGYLTRSTYTARGKPIQITYPDDSQQSFVYFLDGTLKEKTDQNGRKTVFQRDAFGRVLQSKEQASDGSIIQTLVYNYDQSSLTSITDGKSFTIRFFYDGAGRQLATHHETKDGIKRREWSYDACGQKVESREWFGDNENDFVAKIEEKDSYQQTIGIHIKDAEGQIQKSQSISKSKEDKSIFSKESTTQNDRGQYVRQEESVDPQGLIKIITYDALNRPENLVVLNSLGLKVLEKQFRYDGSGNKVVEKQAVIVDGQTIRMYAILWNYDSLKRLVSIQEGVGSSEYKRTSYHYNSQGLLEAMVKSDGIALQYTYDAAGRPSRFYASDRSFDYHYTYDELGRPISVTDTIHSTTINRRYNAFNDIIEEIFEAGLSIKNAYDLAGRKVAMILPDQSEIHYQYQGAFLKSVKRLNVDQKPSYEHSYFYDTKTGSAVGSRLIGDAGDLSYHYNNEGCIESIQSSSWSETIPSDGFDASKHLVKILIQDPAGSTQQSFTYTADHQLATEEGHFNHQYEYDSIHNRISCDGHAWEVNEFNQLIKADNYAYHYDRNGNLIEKKSDEATISYEYDALNRLKRVVKDQTMAIQYLYDPWHRRTAQKSYRWDGESEDWQLVKTDYFLYDENKEIGRVNAEGIIEELRILGIGKGAEISAAVAIELRDEVYAPIHDHQGSVRCLINMRDQNVAEFYRYSAYGQEQIFDGGGNQIETSIVGNPWRFASKRYDSETGFNFFGKRYYDSSIGRWTTPDPLFFSDGPNLYAFVKNDPLTHNDLYGLFSISSIWETVVQTFYEGWLHIQRASCNIHDSLKKELQLTGDFISALERVGKKLVGDSMVFLMGYYRDPIEVGSHGQGEISDKVRITFINGILTNRAMLQENLEVISKSHGGVNIHYIFRPTEGWTWDVGRALLIKLAYNLGFKSVYTHLLAQTWKNLIQEMGGTEGGGTIIHYAHSLGGSDTDRAKDLLTPEEQRMIRIVSLGSSTLIRNEGYQSVINYISINDGVSSFFIEPFGHFRNYFDPNSNVVWKNEFFSLPCWPLDHLLTGNTYRSILFELGEKFLVDFAPNKT